MLSSGLSGRYQSAFHVKWFIRDYDWTPAAIPHVVTPVFLFWLSFTLIILIVASTGRLSMAHAQSGRIRLIARFRKKLRLLKPKQLLLLRIGLSLGLLLQLWSGSYLAPVLASSSTGIHALLIVAILGLVHRKTLFMSGVSLATLFVIASLEYGLFHTLDYMFYLGVIYALCAANSKLERYSSTVLYVSTGLSLAWLAMEKFTLAKLACSLMHEYGIQSLGFTVEDFVLISAFIEMGLAWAFIAGLMNRLCAVLLTGLFLTTTTIFGMKEVVGHTVVHTLLILFLIGGRDRRSTLYRLIPHPLLRFGFTVLAFLILLFGLMALYVWMGQPSSGLTEGIPSPSAVWPNGSPRPY